MAIFTHIFLSGSSTQSGGGIVANFGKRVCGGFILFLLETGEGSKLVGGVGYALYEPPMGSRVRAPGNF